MRSADAAMISPTDPIDIQTSPDGMIRIELRAEEWSNSHWVNSPRVLDMRNSNVVLDLWGTDWDAVANFPRPGAVRLSCRRYHVGGSLDVTIDIDRGWCQIVLPTAAGGTLPETPIARLADELEAASHIAAASIPNYRSPIVQPQWYAAWRSALVVLAAALIAIAGIAWTARQLANAPQPPLAPPPAMPR
jgi:hypothetical protein